MKRVVGLREERRVRGFLYSKAADAGESPRYDLARPILELSDATPNPTIIAGATWRPSKPRLGILRRRRHLRRRPTEDAQVARRSSTNAHVEENAGRCTVHVGVILGGAEGSCRNGQTDE